MKPSTTAVMRQIIAQIRLEFPFQLGEAELCTDTCTAGCPLKLLEYMDQEIHDWEKRLDSGEAPNFGDIQKMTKTGQKIHQILAQNQLVNPPETRSR